MGLGEAARGAVAGSKGGAWLAGVGSGEGSCGEGAGSGGERVRPPLVDVGGRAGRVAPPPLLGRPFQAAVACGICLRGRQKVNIYEISIFKLDPVTGMLDRLYARKFTPECLTVAFWQPPCWHECLFCGVRSHFNVLNRAFPALMIWTRVLRKQDRVQSEPCPRNCF